MSTRLNCSVLTALLLSVSGASCNPDYTATPVPYTCSTDQLCPSGFRCSAGYCVPSDVTDLPIRTALSSSIFRPVLYNDPDRGGVMGCWTPIEAQGSAHAGIDAVFFDGSGAPSGPVRLESWDSTDTGFRASCAPIPHTQGAILIARWTERLGIVSMRIDIWRPTTPNGISGTTDGFYEEFNQGEHPLFINNELPMNLAVVNDRVWVPFEQPYTLGQALTVFPRINVVRLEVGADELSSGRPRRDASLVNTAGVTTGYVGDIADMELAGIDGRNDAAWVVFGRLNKLFVEYPEMNTAPMNIPMYLPVVEEGFGQVLGAREDTIALTIGDPFDPTVLGLNMRIAYFTNRMFRGYRSSRLPFNRADTKYPGSMLIGDRLYLIAARAGAPIQNVPLDGGADGGGGADDGGGLDAGGDEGGTPSIDAGASTGGHDILSLWSTAWKDPDPGEIRLERTYERYLGNNAVVAASAYPLPGGHKFALAWVEHFPADSAGHGVRYVGYAQSFDF